MIKRFLLTSSIKAVMNELRKKDLQIVKEIQGKKLC